MKTPDRVKALYNAGKLVSDAGRPYKWGGGHDRPLSQLRYNSLFDCSSSTSYVLRRAGLWGEHDWAFSSWDFARWGAPGRGRWFTVWYNGAHVWIQFHGVGRFWRFDTSIWGNGGRGPRMRMTPRPKHGFKARHWPGL